MFDPQTGPFPAKPRNRTKDVRIRVQRHSPHRLLRKKVVLPGGITISAERHRGRLVVRVEMTQGER
jgi:hypothetical protein